MEQPLMVDGHVHLGHTTDLSLPDRFNAPDTGAFVPQSMGGGANDTTPYTDSDD